MKKIESIPFDGNEMQNWFSKWAKDSRPALPFYDELEYDRYEMGSRTLTVFLKSKTDGTIYRMFYSEFDKIIRSQLLDKGVIRGMWDFCQKSGYYSLTYMGSV